MRSILSLTAAIGLASASSSTPVEPRQQVCNLNADFCGREYSNVSFIGTHDSAFVGSLVDPRVNQEVNVTAQLDAGIRFLQAQTHIDDGVVSLCHTSCIELYAGPLQNYLSNVTAWLDANPNDVLTLLLVNGDNLGIGNFSAVFEAAGISKYAFVPSTSPNMLSIGDWPTYGELISAGTRLVAFLDTGADESQVPYILDEFTYFFETPYDTTDPSFNECSLNRPPNGSPDGRMYIVNHFLDTEVFSTGILIPDNLADYETNAATGNGSIGAQSALCESIYGRPPNFVLVDMFDRGDVFTAQNTLNGVS